MGKQLTRMIFAGMLCGTSTLALAAPVLNAISHRVSAGEQVELRLELSEPVKNPTSFTIDNPARIAIDLPGVKVGAVEKVSRIDTGIVRDVRSIEAGGRTRVVVDLVQLAPYSLKTDGNALVLSFAKGGGAVSTAPARQGVKSKKSDRLVTSIDFRRGVDGQAQLFLKLSDPSTSIDIDERLGKINVSLIGARIPENLERRLDVTDFATPVTTIDALNTSTGAKITLSTHGLYQYMAYQTGDVYTVEVKPIAKEEAEAAKKAKYTGEKLSLNFQNIEVRAVLQLLADFTGLNIVASDTVQGNITLRLKNVPWDQAMDIVLKTRGLGMRRNGNVIMVAPNAELAALEKQELESKKQIQEVEPLKTRFYTINYAKAADIAKLLKGDKNSILSSRGSVTIDDRTNTLMVLDTEDKLNELEGLIKKLDVPIRQVLIESRIVIANSSFGKQLGTKFGVTEISNNPPRTGTTGALATSGTIAGTNTIANNVISNGNVIPNPPVSTFDSTVNNRLNTNFGATGNAAKIALAILGKDYLVDLELSALQTEGKGEVLSNPRVITSNQKEAHIEQGVEIPYQAATASGATNVSFKKAVLSLSVTPQITPDDRVIMDLDVTKDSVGDVVLGTPSINKREVKTQVLVNNGDTVVLGGIYETSSTDNQEKIPLLGDIPILGHLFRHDTHSDTQSELLIFVSPKILKEGQQAALQ